ncbi:MAG: family 16 glycosylhydrolase [Akkermansiaceae bacterium]|jgi:beta-glucanase (GH16 family)|nr:family 16 glycosylhydrolase [Akkermansiaceae bacterium]MDP4721352.1 family 16 glycosylhydrolase [Akkermansiaceae bacterium]MDP4779427.1 family 16 glycosylhydrolase [Akkermansiaceae bacterium]MDP4846767.1 family 16 glycosylhydrolase [Akkermansiaceae bacterium]MDP4897104.1 family 16 glycosylhydrolase [Akkermansiaceae bacterium]
MKSSIFIHSKTCHLILLALAITGCESPDKKITDDSTPQPLLEIADPEKKWVLDERFSDEFDSAELNATKWDKNLAPWGDRAWTPENVNQKDGSLIIRATHEPHKNRGEDYYYKVGILRSFEKTTYGYFEARIKGCSKFPGLCPAFWLYSYGNNPEDLNPDYPKVTYSEIDVVEMLQGVYDPGHKRVMGPNYIDCNLHTRIINEEGKEIWRRPNSFPEICRNGWEAPWDPRDDYHVYAVENTPEKITWFIDGKKVAESENLYWHLPMSVTLTLEPRPPLISWSGVDGREPVPEASTAEGFPTEMAVDYVRCWKLSESSAKPANP